MEWKEYIEKAKQTESHIEELNVNKDFLVAALRLNVLSGELLDCIKKLAFYDNPTKLEKNMLAILREIGQELDSLKRFNRLPRGFLYGEEIEKPDVNTRIAHSLIGIITEASEMSEAFVNALNSGEFDIVNIKEEFFDSDWYKAIGSDEMGIDWGEGWQNNIDKLHARYNGSFSKEAANNRDLDSERKILEGNNGE